MNDPLRAAIEDVFVVEREGWAYERVVRVTDRLQAGVPDAARLETLVIWHDSHGAFTGPGKTIYFGRRLLERLPDDDAAAFVIAHELAHHRLGHVPTLRRAMLQLPVRLVLAGLARWIASTQHESDADLLAIEMCIDAGYDVERCVHALEQLSLVSLDYGDVDGVLGGGERRVHPPLAQRIDAARAHAARVRSGVRLVVDLDERRRIRRRRMAIAAGAAAVALAVIVVRRR